MYNVNNSYPYNPYHYNNVTMPMPVSNPYNTNNAYRGYQAPYFVSNPVNTQMNNPYFSQQYQSNQNPFVNMPQNVNLILKDYGPQPFVINIDKATKQNDTYRTALWTGEYLQLTLMSLKAGEDIGLEVHPDLDQFVRIEEGEGIVQMGDTKASFDFQRKVYDDFAFIIPAGKWHNLTNTSTKPLKLYSIYAPPQHPYGTVHKTKQDA